MALEFVLKLKDLLTPQLGPSLRRADGALAQLQQRATVGSRQMGASIDSVRTKIDQLRSTANQSTSWKIFSDATREANRLEQQIDRLNRRVGNRSSSSTSSPLGLSGLLGGGLGGGMMGSIGLGAGLFESVKLAGKKEQTDISFGVMLGDEKKGKAMSNQLFNFAANTPYQTPEVYKSAQTQLAFGIKDKDIMKNMQMLGDVAMGDADKLGSLTLAFSQTNAAGKLMGQDLLQYVNAGFNPLQEISAATGIKMSLLRKQMEKGAISAEVVAMAFQHATQKGGRFYKLMEKEANTTLGLWSTLMDNAKMKLIAFGDWLEPVTNALIDFASVLIQNKISLLMIGGGLAVVAWATIGWATAWNTLTAAMAANPITAIIIVVLILGGLIYALIKGYDGWGKSMMALWNITKMSTKQMLLSWKEFGQGIWYWVEYGWLKFKGFVEWVEGAVGNLGRALMFLGKLDFANAKKALTATILVSADTQLAQLKKSREGQLKGNQNEIGKLAYSIALEKGKIGLTKVKGSGSINPLTATKDLSKSDLMAGLKRGGADMDKLKGDAEGAMGAHGQKTITININRGLVEKLELHTVNMKEGMQEIEQVVKETFLRIINSANGMAVN